MDGFRLRLLTKPGRRRPRRRRCRPSAIGSCRIRSDSGSRNAPPARGAETEIAVPRRNGADGQGAGGTRAEPTGLGAEPAIAGCWASDTGRGLSCPDISCGNATIRQCFQSISAPVSAPSDAGIECARGGAAECNSSERHAAATHAAAAVRGPILSRRTNAPRRKSTVPAVRAWCAGSAKLLSSTAGAPNPYAPAPMQPPGGMPNYYPQQGAAPGFAGNYPPQGMPPQAMMRQPTMPQPMAPQTSPAAGGNFLDDVLSGPRRGGTSPMDELGFGDSGTAPQTTEGWQTSGGFPNPAPASADAAGGTGGAPAAPYQHVDYEPSETEASPRPHFPRVRINLRGRSKVLARC